MRKALEEFGLSSNEGSVYLASLQLGLARVNEISKKSRLLRETTYGVINSLSAKGLMSYVVKSGVRYFEAAKPARLKQILKEKEEVINKVMPDLLGLGSAWISKPGVEFYEGKEGLKTVIEDLLNAKDEILGFVSTDNLREIFEFYFPNVVKRREKLGINVRLLTDGEPFSKFLVKSKILPKSFAFKTCMWIYNDKVTIVSLNQNEPIGVMIKDKDISFTQKNVFELVWKLLK